VKTLIEGRPGIGKTTVATRLMTLLQRHGVSVVGFVTTEQRERGRRVGFTVEATTGRSATLAHVDLAGPPREGRYGVDLDAFERVALPVLDSVAAVTVIDELGKMELASASFTARVLELFGTSRTIVATVHRYAHPVTDALKARQDVGVVGVDRDGRNDLPARLVRDLLGDRPG
jgi:nucleoside-triphosphatase